MGAFHHHYKRKYGVVRAPARAYENEHIVVTTVNDQRVSMKPAWELHNALNEAFKIADMKRDVHAVVDVVCWNFADLCWSLGFDPRSLNITRDEVAAALKVVLLEAPDPYDRRQAFDELTKMGVIRR